MADQIHDLILQNFQHSIDFLSEFFGTDPTDTEQLRPFVKVLAALRALPREAMNDIVHPVLTAQFAAFNLDPKSAEDRAQAVDLVDLMALGVQDATNMIMQAMQNQHAAAAAIAQGKGHLLRG